MRAERGRQRFSEKKKARLDQLDVWTRYSCEEIVIIVQIKMKASTLGAMPRFEIWPSSSWPIGYRTGGDLAHPAFTAPFRQLIAHSPRVEKIINPAA